MINLNTMKKAKEIVTFKTGKLDSNAAEEGGIYPFFTCSQETFRINSFAFNTECVLLAGNNASGIFPLKYYKGKFNAYQRTYVIEPKDKEVLDIRYFYFYLRPLLSSFQQQATGATTKFLTLKILNNLDVLMPKIEIQRKIAAILSAYDDLIKNNKRHIALLEKMAEEIYREWFERYRFPRYKNAKFNKGIPKGWQLRPIGELCAKVTDGSHLSPAFFEGGKYMASVKDMTAYGFEKNTLKTISEKDYEKLVKSDCKPLDNDVLIAKDGSYLKHVFVWKENYDVVILSSIAILRPDIKEILPIFFSMVLRQESTKSMMSGFVSGSALPRIILKDFKKMNLLIPDFYLMKTFETSVTSIFNQIENLLNQSETLSKSKDMLLPRLISGKLSVEKLDIKFPPSMLEEETTA